MKQLLLTTIAAVLVVGCGESQQSAPAPETKPVEPVAEVPSQPSPPPAAVEPPEPIAEAAKPTTPPKAVSANKGADPARGINPELTTAKAPDISIHEAVKQGYVESVKKHMAAGTDINLRFISENWIANVRYRNKKSSRNWQIPEFNPATGEMRGTGNNFIIISWKWDDEQPKREIMAVKGTWESGGWTFHQVRDYKPTEGFPEAHPITLHETLRLEEFDEKPFHFAPITPLDYALVFKQSEIADLLLEHGANTSEELEAEGKLTEPVAEAGKAPKTVSANKGSDLDRGIKQEPPTAKAPDISIHRAARDGNIEAVKQHLDAGVNVNANDYIIEPPLHLAADNGHKEMVELLIDKGADVNLKTKMLGITPLLKVVEKGHKEMVELLIDKGADVNLKTDFGQTPLLKAVEKGHKEMVELLIDKGADVNLKTDFDQTPLHLAAENGQKEMVELLIAKGANVNAHDGLSTPFDIAVESNKTQTADLIRKKGGKMIEELSIVYASKKGNIIAIKNHLTAGADVNSKDDDGFAALHLATTKEVVELLIAKGANVNAKADDGFAALHLATTKEVVELLITKGANVNAKAVNGQTPLHVAGNKEIAELLLSKDANVNAKDQQGMTPLHMQYGYPEIAKLLISNGANVNAQIESGSAKGFRPLDLVEDEETKNLLIKNGAKNGMSQIIFHKAVVEGDHETVKIGIESGMDVNVKGGFFERTPLSTAASKGHIKILELLITKGAEVDKKDSFKVTPLHRAARSGHKSVSELLISKNANVNAIDIYGGTPLDYASKYKEIADLLRKHGGKTGEELKAEGK
jgi:ankyrin repeat protein